MVCGQAWRSRSGREREGLGLVAPGAARQALLVAQPVGAVRVEHRALGLAIVRAGERLGVRGIILRVILRERVRVRVRVGVRVRERVRVRVRVRVVLSVILRLRERRLLPGTPVFSRWQVEALGVRRQRCGRAGSEG